MKRLCDLTYGIVGMGLMGGSIAKAIRGNVLCAPGAEGRLFGCDVSRASLEQSLKDGVADAAYGTEQAGDMLSVCDVVFVCLYPEATVQFLERHRASFKRGAVVTDISGVKAQLFSHMDAIARDDVDFVPGHPMAGSEREGYAHSGGGIFAGHNYILMPLPENSAEGVDLLRALVTEMGFSRIVTTTCAVHDHKIAFTSQLCHVIASALVDSAEDTQVTAFGGGSFEDLTRIAMINAPLWTELFLANRDELLLHVGRFKESLGALEDLLKAQDAAGLEAYLERVRAKRSQMGTIRHTAEPL